MAMNRTEGYYKAFIDVCYINDAGITQHIASFQIATSREIEYCVVRKERFDKEGEIALAESVRSYITHLRDVCAYDLVITSHLMA